MILSMILQMIFPKRSSLLVQELIQTIKEVPRKDANLPLTDH